MNHIGMRVYWTAVAMFVSSLLASVTASRDRKRHKARSADAESLPPEI
jgi:hypothetical protein